MLYKLELKGPSGQIRIALIGTGMAVNLVDNFFVSNMKASKREGHRRRGKFEL
jgi:hypothetical protein